MIIQFYFQCAGMMMSNISTSGGLTSLQYLYNKVSGGVHVFTYK